MQTFRVLMFNKKKNSLEAKSLHTLLQGYVDNGEHCMPGMDRFSFRWWEDGHMIIENAGTSLGQALADKGYRVDMSQWVKCERSKPSLDVEAPEFVVVGVPLGG